MTDTPTPTPGDEEEVVVAEVSETVVVAGDYPVDVDAQLLPEYARFMPLIKWLILVPHYICLFFLAIGAIGVSGETPQQDEDIAMVGAQALATP